MSVARSSSIARLVLIFGVLTLLGATLNVPFAMQFLRSPSGPPVTMSVSRQGPAAAATAWPVETPHTTPWPALDAYIRWTAFAYELIDARSYDGQTPVCAVEVERIGWPLPVLQDRQYWWDWNDTTLVLKPGADRDPPLELLWPGLVANPVLFGAAAWAPIALVFFLAPGIRRARRRARGQCERCGYPQGESERCSECGAATTRSGR